MASAIASVIAAAASEAAKDIPATEFPAKAVEVLNVWFGTPDEADHLKFRMWWFQSTTELDETLKAKFEEPLRVAQAGGLLSWEAHPETLAAKIILLDQMGRNIHRGTASAFAGDSEALRCTMTGLASGAFRGLPDIVRYFCLMPLIHSESLDVQRRAQAEFPTLSFYAGMGVLQREVEKHVQMIERFGRFPHRNAVLGRASTPAEVAYLEETNAHYGQAPKRTEAAAAAPVPSAGAVASPALDDAVTDATLAAAPLPLDEAAAASTR
jgi:uncharacterized protein (DUF924 family)